MPRYAKAFIIALIALCLITSLTLFRTRLSSFQEFGRSHTKGAHDIVGLEEVEHGQVIMPHLGNATTKEALGRATWKLLHTITLRYPEHPKPSERAALVSYLHLTARLYPCGECAVEFQQLLKKYPPQTSSRRAASLWLCTVHNAVNARLEKPEFDCAHLDAEYDCGCGDS